MEDVDAAYKLSMASGGLIGLGSGLMKEGKANEPFEAMLLKRFAGGVLIGAGACLGLASTHLMNRAFRRRGRPDNN